MYILFYKGHKSYFILDMLVVWLVIYLLKFSMINKYYYYKIRFKVQHPPIFPNALIGNGTRKFLVTII